MSVTRVEKPWGHELHWAKTERYVGKVLHIKAGHALSLQYHNQKDETIYLHSGLLLFEIQDGKELVKREMRPGERVQLLREEELHRLCDAGGTHATAGVAIKSTNGGSSWTFATSAPTINSSTSMTIAVNNTVVQTIPVGSGPSGIAM